MEEMDKEEKVPTKPLSRQFDLPDTCFAAGFALHDYILIGSYNPNVNYAHHD